MFFSNLSAKLRRPSLGSGENNKCFEPKSSTPYCNQVYEFARTESNINLNTQQDVNVLPCQIELDPISSIPKSHENEIQTQSDNARNPNFSYHKTEQEHHKSISHPDSSHREILFSDHIRNGMKSVKSENFAFTIDKNVNPCRSLSESNLREFFGSPGVSYTPERANGFEESFPRQLVDYNPSLDRDNLRATRQTYPVQRENDVSRRLNVSEREHVTGDSEEFDGKWNKSSVSDIEKPS